MMILLFYSPVICIKIGKLQPLFVFNIFRRLKYNRVGFSETGFWQKKAPEGK